VGFCVYHSFLLIVAKILHNRFLGSGKIRGMEIKLEPIPIEFLYLVRVGHSMTFSGLISL